MTDLTDKWKKGELPDGCATCLNKACHTALQQIKELEK